MTLDTNDFRINRNTLARRYGRTTRCIDLWIAAGKLPQPERDEGGKPFWWASTIARHEAALAERAA